MKRVQRMSVVEMASIEMKKQILSGAWPVGQRIPTEVELIEVLGASRTSIREAIRSLTGLGLLEARQGVGTFVLSTEGVDGGLHRILETSDVLDVIAVRKGLDVVAAREAALRHNQDDLEELRQLLDLRRKGLVEADAETFEASDLAFHIGVAKASHNSVLMGLYKFFGESVKTTVQDQCLRNASRTDDDPHDFLFAAIESRDSIGATTAALSILEERVRALDIT